MLNRTFADHLLGIYIGSFTCAGVYFAADLVFLQPDPVSFPFGLLIYNGWGFSLWFFLLLPVSLFTGSALALPWSGKFLCRPQYAAPKRYRFLYITGTLFRDGFFTLGAVALLALFFSGLYMGFHPDIPIPLEYVRNTALAVFLAGWFGSLVPGLVRSVFRAKKVLPMVGCLCVCLMTGCSSKGIGGSFVGGMPDGGAVEAIAADASGQIAGLYPPGHTSLFVLTPKKDADNGFSLAFDNALRRSGFTLLPIPGESAVAVAYVLDGLAEEKDSVKVWYLQLLVSDNDEGGIALARSYTSSGRAEAGWTRTDVPFSRSVASRMADKVSRKAGKAYDRAVEYVTE